MKQFIIHKKALLTSTLLILSLFSANIVTATVYDFKSLNTIPFRDFNHSTGLDINNAGEVTGDAQYIDGNFCQSAFLYSNNKMNCLGVLDSDIGSAGIAINNNSQVVGYSGGIGNKAFLYENGTMTNIGSLGGSPNSFANGINDSGQIVGRSTTSSSSTHAFLYENGAMVSLGTLGGSHSGANDINDVGQIVGQSTTSSSNTHAFLYEGGAMVSLGTLGGSDSAAWAINDVGQIVGEADINSSSTHAFLYENGAMVDLGALTNFENSRAYGVNNIGQVVGWSGQVESGSQGLAFIYESGEMKDLNSMVNSSLGNWSLIHAYAINDHGWITGRAFNPVLNQYHAYLLTPVPEPSIYALMGLGFFGLVAYSRKRKLQ